MNHKTLPKYYCTCAFSWDDQRCTWTAPANVWHAFTYTQILNLWLMWKINVGRPKTWLQICEVSVERKFSDLQVYSVSTKYNEPLQDSLAISVPIRSLWRHTHFQSCEHPTELKWSHTQASEGLWHVLTTKHMLTSSFGSGSCFQIFYMHENMEFLNYLCLPVNEIAS